MIPLHFYLDSASFETELSAMFHRGWLFGAMSEELANDQDFVCVDLPATPIVIQNFGGQLRAFRNVCTHRLNLIQTERTGNRPLTCRYHGWSFNSEGEPKTLPPRQKFLDEQPLDQLCLQRFHVDTCGRFVFFSLEAEPPPLRTALGDFAEVLADVSEAMGNQIGSDVMEHAANWKLLVENVLECYHCGFVHPETFVAGLGIGKQPITNVRIDGGHSSSHFPKSPTARDALKARAIAHLAERAWVHDSFFHIHIYPNLFISSSEGTSFYVGQALPRSVSSTDLVMRFFEPNVPFDHWARIRQDAINGQAVRLGKAVIEEDRAVLETVQRGVASAQKMAVFGADEVRLRNFAERHALAVGT